MVAAAKKLATLADIDALPEGIVGEILFGSLVTQPRPVFKHGAVHMGLGAELTPLYQRGRGGPGGWVFATEPQLHLRTHVVVPDIAGWRKERVDFGPDVVGIETAPDWVCEILSPSTERYDRGMKRIIYAEAGVEYYWILDPRSNHLECFTRFEKNWLHTHTFSNEEIVSAPPFELAQFTLNDLWPFDEKPSE